MAIAGSPRKFAQDIADGYLSLSPTMLKAYTPADLKTLAYNLTVATRDIRAEQVPLEDVMAVKAKNMRLSRLNQASVVLRAYCTKKRIPL